MTATAMMSAAMSLVIAVLMMIAVHIRVISKTALDQCFYRIIRVAADSAVKLNPGFGQRRLCSAANTAADQRVYALFL